MASAKERIRTVNMTYRSIGGVALAVLASGSASAQWVNFVNETSTRMPVGAGLNDATLSTTDPEEKDYAFGDVDKDGDIDLVCVRKQPFTTSGRKRNVLFMNEGIAEGHAINGVLVDRSAQFAVQTTVTATFDDPQVPGGEMPDQGFLTPTNDRDVVLADINNDTWLDIVTATTLSEGTPKWINHPRVYLNLKEVNGVWQGFKYQAENIPQMHPSAPPRFCSVAAGDVTGDGYVDLYFGDYDSGPAEQFDYNNKLLVNEGLIKPGAFTDSGTTRMSSNPGLLSAFGAASVIADMNGDGVLDVVKQTSLNSPLHVAVQHNNPANIGFFPDSTYKIVNQNAPYFVSAGDLNNDGKLDLVITDDNADRYHLNQGNAANGTANFGSATFSFQTGGDDGFGSQSVIADLNNDGWNDVLISDVDVDITGCNRRAHIYRNLGNAPNITLQEQTPVVIPNSMLVGTFNIAAFDINNDGWQDLVIGRCSGTQVWINVPPAGVVFSYPSGLPAYLTPGEETQVGVQLSAFSGGSVMADSAKVYISVDGGPFAEGPIVSNGNNLYTATLPSVPCPQKVNFYFTGQLANGNSFTDPAGAPGNSYVAVSALGTEITLNDTIEGDVTQWSVVNDGSLTSGAWEAVDPIGTIASGVVAAPEEDATGGSESVKAFVTQNGAVGGGPGAADVDGGPTNLLSPVLDLAGTDATISYSRWFFRDNVGDALLAEVSNDSGKTWTLVHTVTGTTDGANTAWETASFVVGDYVQPTAEVRVRFSVADTGTPSIIEAGIDNFRVEEIICGGGSTCAADIMPAGGNGAVDTDDLLAVINAWGKCDGCPADITDNLIVDVDDLLAVINGWGACP